MTKAGNNKHAVNNAGPRVAAPVVVALSKLDNSPMRRLSWKTTEGLFYTLELSLTRMLLNTPEGGLTMAPLAVQQSDWTVNKFVQTTFC